MSLGTKFNVLGFSSFICIVLRDLPFEPQTIRLIGNSMRSVLFLIKRKDTPRKFNRNKILSDEQCSSWLVNETAILDTLFFVAKKAILDVDKVVYQHSLEWSHASHLSGITYTVIFKVAFSTFWFKFGATLRRQAERRDSGTRQKASNLAQPIS